jgi:hypothetical protein
MTRSLIRMKSRTMRWAGQVARIGEEERRVWVIDAKSRGKETTMKTKT